ncbi:11288_t:CDS:2, partial [Acaulospora morrowiae]
QNIREPGTGYFYRAMTAKLYRQGMVIQRWDFGNTKKHSRDPVNDPADCNAPNLPAFQITIPISEVFWNPPFPITPAYAPIIPANVIGTYFNIDLYRIQRTALKAEGFLQGYPRIFVNYGD